MLVKFSILFHDFLHFLFLPFVNNDKKTLSLTQMPFYPPLQCNGNSSKQATYLSALKDMDADRKSRFASLWP